MAKELDKVMLTPEEIASIVDAMIKAGTQDYTTIAITNGAKTQLAKARKVIAEEERKRVGQTLQSMVDNAPPNHKLRQIENWTKYYLLGEQNLKERYQGER